MTIVEDLFYGKCLFTQKSILKIVLVILKYLSNSGKKVNEEMTVQKTIKLFFRAFTNRSIRNENTVSTRYPILPRQIIYCSVFI